MVVKARRAHSESPIAESDRAAITIDAIRALDRAAAKGILHRNNAARRKSRLMRQLVKVGGSVKPAAAPAARGKKKGATATAAAPAAAPAKGDKKAKK